MTDKCQAIQWQLALDRLWKYIAVDAKVSSAVGIITIAFGLLVVLAEFVSASLFCVLLLRFGIIFVVLFDGRNDDCC